MDEFKIPVVPRPWNKGKLIGQKAPLKLREIWAIRVRLQVFRRTRELALFIPRLVDQDPWAQLRRPMDMIRQG
jgi:hypothetical protein